MTGAIAFVDALRAHADPTQLPAITARLGAEDEAFGIRMRDLFDVAKAAAGMALDEVESLFASPLYEVRMGAICILDFRAKNRRTSDDDRARLCSLYLGNHDRITTWDMVDRAAPSVVGGHLVGRSPAPLHHLATSSDPLRRRTAITAPLWFVRYGSDRDVATTYTVAATLAADPEPVVQHAVGIALKHAGGRDPAGVGAFLDEHAATLSRAAVRAAVSKLDPDVRSRFVG